MLTTLLIILPIIGAIGAIAAGASNAKRVALATTIAELGLALFAYTTYTANPADASLTTNVTWSATLGSNFHVGMDGISMLMVLLTAIVAPLIVLSSFSKEYSNSRSFYALLLTMISALVGVFTALDGLVYYVFWELALIPIWLFAYFGAAKVVSESLLNSSFIRFSEVYLCWQRSFFWRQKQEVSR
jgi:NADH-quinone oxidoreductase subunit M